MGKTKRGGNTSLFQYKYNMETQDNKQKDWANWKDQGYIPSKWGWKKGVIKDHGNFGYPTGFQFSDSIRAAMIAFGNFFNDLWVVRFDENGVPRKNIRVPLKFGPRSKAYDFRKENESGETYYIPQPNMFYKITGIAYDTERATSVDQLRTFYDTYLFKNNIEYRAVDQLWQDINPKPLTLSIDLSAQADKMSDILQIIEQIEGKFQPNAHLYVKEFWFMNIRRDLKLTLEGTSLEYNEDYGEEDKREITAKFSFKLECMIYSGIDYGAIIDTIITKLNPNLEKQQQFQMDVHFSGDANGHIHMKDSLASEYGIFDLVETGTSGWSYYTVNSAAYEDKSVTSGWDGDYIDFHLLRNDVNATGDGYSAQFGIYGNYKIDYDNPANDPAWHRDDSANNHYIGSLTDRYDFGNMEYSFSGEKQYENSDHDIIDTTYVVTHTNNEGYKY